MILLIVRPQAEGVFRGQFWLLIVLSHTASLHATMTDPEALFVRQRPCQPISCSFHQTVAVFAFLSVVLVTPKWAA